jgi:hypothetical protein
VKRAFVSCIVYRSFVSCIVCSYFVLCVRLIKLSTTLKPLARVVSRNDASPSDGDNTRLVCVRGDHIDNRPQCATIDLEVPIPHSDICSACISQVKLPEAFVYIHVDVTHVDDFLFICP